MNNKQNHIPTAIVLLFSLAISACGGGGGGGSTTTPTTYTVGGTLSGLEFGATVGVEMNGGTTTLTENGSFSVYGYLGNDAYYTVSVSVQPTSPYQTCTVSGQSEGTISGADITNISVDCVTDSFIVSGTVSGLAASSSITIQNNGADDITVSSSSNNFTFPAALSGSTYSVTVLSQPSLPSQICTVNQGNGTLQGWAVTNVEVACVTDTFTIGGTLSGLASSASVTLQNNSVDDLVLSTDGSFTFATAIMDGTPYNVTVLTQPTSTHQDCTVTNATGTLNSANVADISVVCVSDTFASGLAPAVAVLGSSTTPTVSVALGDVDGDNDLDLVSGNLTQSNKVYINDGTAGFTDSGQALGGTNNTYAIALGDVDGDNDLDLVSANGSAQANLVFVNDGSGAFSNSGQSLGNFDTRAITLGDVDGDGDLDIVTGNAFTGSTVVANRIYLNDGSGVFSDSGQTLGNDFTYSVVLGDLNGDGDLDLVTGNSSADLVYFNNGTGTFTDSAVNSLLNDTGTTSSLALGDLDGDGDLDLVKGVNSGASRIYFNQNNSGIFSESTQTLNTGLTKSVILVDLDGDLDLDIVHGNSSTQASQIYLNDSTGVFTEHASGQALGTQDIRSLSSGDLDGDNDIDLVSGNYNQANEVFTNLSN